MQRKAVKFNPSGRHFQTSPARFVAAAERGEQILQKSPG
jgi:hypothetical protein